MSDPEQQLNDYFETEAFKMRHVEQHLRTIAQALNALEREGWELRDGEFTLSAAHTLPFGLMEPTDARDDMPEKHVVWYDVERNEWRSDKP